MNNQGYRPPQQNNWYAPPPQQKPAAKKRTSKPPQKKRQKTSLKQQFLKLLIVLVLLGAACAAGYVWKAQSDVKPYANVFLDNVSVDGIDLSGKTWEEGSRLVWDQINQKQNGWYVRLRNQHGDYKDITAATLGISFDPTAALEQAWAIGHNSQMSAFELRTEIELAKTQTNAFSSAEQSADTTPIDTILSTLEQAAYRAPSDAYIISFNPDDLNNPFTFQPEVYGQRLDTTAIREQILSMVQNLQSGEILLQTELLYPNVTVDQLKKTVELRNRSVTSISTTSTEDRTENIRIAFAKINGTILRDGDKFSFNKVVGRRTMENGFLPAIEYAYGQQQMGWGGGVCQASTTMYLAAVQSGMKILKREPHSMAVNYTELGMDATVSDTKGREIDFTFQNTTGGPVYIAAHVTQSSSSKRRLVCDVRIYGPSLNGLSYKLESEVAEVIPKPLTPTTLKDKEATYVTYTDEQHVIEGREGYIVNTYLVTSQNGYAIARDLITTDEYPCKEDIIYIGKKERTGGK
ncbi:MAG: VanW family protein [Clostridia bacterium]|nr:VanW family protein [Clostridia bacterium]